MKTENVLNAKKRFSIIILTFILYGFSYKVDAQETIKIFSWWDFIPQETIQHFKKKGIKIEVTEYRSNEVALSKLLNHSANFDVAIISNWVIKILENKKIIDNSELAKILKKRKYLPFLADMNEKYLCAPYLWSTTTYAVDTSISNIKPMNLFELENLKREGFTLGIIDDAIEFGAIALLSYDEKCAKSLRNHELFTGLFKCNFPSFSTISKTFQPSDFRNSIKSIVGRKTALYGWSGEIGEALEKYDYMNFVEPSHPPIIGMDSVCIVKKKKIDPKVAKFVEEFTDRKITKLNAEKMQYFSPYENLNIKHSPKIKKLEKIILEKIKANKPILLYPPDLNTQRQLNDWWQKIRYEKN